MVSVLNSEEIEQFLKSQIIGRLGCHADRQTYVVPISYVYDGEFIYCHSYEGLKLSMMRKNPDVCFEVDQTSDMAKWKSVIVQGTFSQVEDAEERNYGMKLLLGRYLPIISSETMHLGKDWPFSPDDTKEIDGILFKITAKQKSGRFESGQDSPAMPG